MCGMVWGVCWGAGEATGRTYVNRDDGSQEMTGSVHAQATGQMTDLSNMHPLKPYYDTTTTTAKPYTYLLRVLWVTYAICDAVVYSRQPRAVGVAYPGDLHRCRTHGTHTQPVVGGVACGDKGQGR